MWARIASRILHRARTKLPSCYKLCIQHVPRVTLASMIIKMGTDESDTKVKLEAPDPSKLTHTYLIRNVAVATLTSANGLLTQTVSAYIEEALDYQDAVQRLIGLYDLSIQVLGNPQMEDKIWDSILQVRSQVNEARTKKDELYILVESSKKLVQAAAEAAFNAGAEHASIMASELVFSTDLEMGKIKEKSERYEGDLVLIEVKAIEMIGEMNEEREKARERREMEEKEREAEQTVETGENTESRDSEIDGNADRDEGVSNEQMEKTGNNDVFSPQNDNMDKHERTSNEGEMQDWFSPKDEMFKEDEDLGKGKT